MWVKKMLLFWFNFEMWEVLTERTCLFFVQQLSLAAINVYACVFVCSVSKKSQKPMGSILMKLLE